MFINLLIFRGTTHESRTDNTQDSLVSGVIIELKFTNKKLIYLDNLSLFKPYSESIRLTYSCTVCSGILTFTINSLHRIGLMFDTESCHVYASVVKHRNDFEAFQFSMLGLLHLSKH